MLRLELGRVANDPYVGNFLEPHVGSHLDAVGRGIRAEEAIHNLLSAQSGSIVSSLHLNFAWRGRFVSRLTPPLLQTMKRKTRERRNVDNFS